MTGILLRENTGDLRHRYTQMRMSYKDGDKKESDISTGQGTPRTTGNLQILGERQGVDSPSKPLEEICSTDTLILGFSLLGQQEDRFPLFKAIQCIVLCYSSPGQLLRYLTS